MILEILAILLIFFLTVALPLVCIGAMHYIAGFPGLYRYRDRTTALPRQWAFVDRRIVTEHWVSLNWLDPSGYVGDTSCRFNAHSPFLRCAVNPDGPCQNCSYYETSPHLTQS
jgi:Family of unknown function (DUF6464)